jgi:hypothetical protein
MNHRLVLLRRVVLNADAPHQWWRIGYHAVINASEDGTITPVVVELAPYHEGRPSLHYMVAVHKGTHEGEAMLTYYGSLLQIEDWLESMIGFEVTFEFTDEDQLNQMTLAQMRKGDFNDL